MTRQHLLVTTVVALLCGAILVLFTDIEKPVLPHPPKAPGSLAGDRSAPGHP